MNTLESNPNNEPQPALIFRAPASRVNSEAKKIRQEPREYRNCSEYLRAQVSSEISSRLEVISKLGDAANKATRMDDSARYSLYWLSLEPRNPFCNAVANTASAAGYRAAQAVYTGKYGRWSKMPHCNVKELPAEDINDAIGAAALTLVSGGSYYDAFKESCNTVRRINRIVSGTQADTMTHVEFVGGLHDLQDIMASNQIEEATTMPDVWASASNSKKSHNWRRGSIAMAHRLGGHSMKKPNRKAWLFFHRALSGESIALAARSVGWDNYGTVRKALALVGLFPSDVGLTLQSMSMA